MVLSTSYTEWFNNTIKSIDITNDQALSDFMARIITHAREHEREEIARELHDNVNQLITSAKLIIDTTRREACIRRELLDISSEILEEAIHEIRQLASSLSQPIPSDFDLQGAIDKFIGTISLSEKIRIVARPARRVEHLLTPQQKLQVYRIIQEQFTNIIRHAGATKVLLCFDHRQHVVRMMIKDNGVGFDVSQKKKGMGLTNIGKRVELLNGSYHIHSAINRGTTLDVWFRIQAA